MTKPWELLEKSRIDALESGYSLIGDVNIQGTGKTYSWSKIILERNINNIILSNNHALLDELYINIDQISNINKFYTYPLWGKKFIFNPFQQGLYNKPKCLCNYYINHSMFKLGILGWWTDGFCKKCIYRYDCRHKRNNKELFTLADRKINKFIMAPKSYIYTDLIDDIIDKFNRLILILDENLLNIMYRQFNLNSDSIRNFNVIVRQMVLFNTELRELYRDIIPIFMAIDNTINYDIGVNNINTQFNTFIESYDIQDVILWNNTLKQTALNHAGYINNTYNIFNDIINILDDGKVNGNFSDNIVIDKYRAKPNFTYFINKIDRVREIVNNVYITICTDASQREETIKALFPDFAEDFKFLYNQTIKSHAKFKSVNIARLGNESYGKYKKNSLINPRTHLITNPFRTIAKETKYIILDEHRNGKNKGLIVAMQEVLKHLKPLFKPIIDRHNLEIYFDYYYYLKGKNAYSNVDWIVLFGSCNIPEDVREWMHKAWNISLKELEWLFGAGTMIDGAHRGRPLLRPNEINLYVFGNIIRGYFDNERNFYGALRIKYKELLDQIKRRGGANIRYISQFLGKSENTTRDLLNMLLDNGVLKWTRKNIGHGQPQKIWIMV